MSRTLCWPTGGCGQGLAGSQGWLWTAGEQNQLMDYLAAGPWGSWDQCQHAGGEVQFLTWLAVGFGVS